ncbi:hypothetical protein [Streptomyces sp. SDr-06]|uniref:hypothetical protein n=1 Tax=Streptomyces sp. SDr-06 TaxID=2267702 RepID=UPI00167A60F5|nr:hypothetical protein [Streptomyces sp. SDr-06]
MGLQAGGLGDEGCGLVQRARHLAVAVQLDPPGGLRGGGEQLREGAEDAVLAVVLVVELAQDLRELRGAGLTGEVVLDLLGASLAMPAAARTRSRRVRVRPVTGGSP